MKKIILYELVKFASKNGGQRRIQSWHKKLKYLTAFVLVGAIVLGGAAVWGVSALVGGIARNMDQGLIQERIAKGQEGWRLLLSQPITTKDCLESMKRALNVNSLLTTPLAENFSVIRSGCGFKSDEPDNQKQS